jgi:hypothetical protein
MQKLNDRSVTKVSGGFLPCKVDVARRLKGFMRGAGEVRGARAVMEGLEGRQMMTLSPVGAPVTVAGAGVDAAIAVAPGGSFDVAWTAFDAEFSGVFVQRFDATGTALGKIAIQANTETALQQFEPDIALSGSDGMFMVVWTNTSSGQFDVRGQLFTAAGEKSGGEIQINTTLEGNQHEASVTALPSTSGAASSGFVVTWLSGGSVKGQIYSHTGDKVGTEFAVDTSAAGAGTTVASPKVDAADDGAFVVTWQWQVASEETSRIYGQRFGSDGSKSGTEFVAATAAVTYADDAATLPTYDMAVAGDGYVVVVYDTFDAEGKNWDVKAQVITNENTSDFGVFMVNSTVSGDQFHPTATFKADGTILVAWEGSATVIESSGRVALARRFVGTGVGGPEIVISSKGDGYADGLYPQIGRHEDSGFTVAWTGFDDATGMNPKVLARVVEDTVTGPGAVVTGNNVVIANGSTQAGSGDGTAFGTVSQGGQEILRTFKVANNGTLTLVTSNLKVPAGFRIVEGLSQTIGAGSFDEFTVALETADARSVSGQVSFGVNMGNTTSYGFAVSGQVQAASNGVYIITKNTPKADRTFIDSNNNRVTFTFTGVGQARLTTDPVTKKFLMLEISGTDAKSSLGVDVNAKGSTTGKNGTATGTGTGAGTVGLITVAGAFNKLTAREMNLTGDFIAMGVVKAVGLGNVGSDVQHEFKLGGTSKDKTDLILGVVKDVTFTSTAAVDSWKMIRWEDNVGAADVITAPMMGTLKVTGVKATSKVTGIAGDFEASLALSGAGVTKPTIKTLGTLEIAGDVVGSASHFFRIEGHMGVVSVAGNMTDSKIIVSQINQLAGSTGKLSSLSVGGTASQVTVDVSGAVGTIKAGQWVDGVITAQSVTAVTVSGRKGGTLPALAGDFSGTVSINPGAAVIKGNALGAMTIAGKVTDTVVSVIGSTGAIAFKGADGLGFSATGKILSFTSTGEVTGATLKAVGEIGAIKSINWMGGEIAALKVASLTISGALKVGDGVAANDYTGELTLGNALSGAITVAGSVNSNFWSAQGSVGAVTVGSASGMNINIAGGLASFTSKGAVTDDTRLKVGGTVGPINAMSWKGGAIEAAKIAVLNTTGRKASGDVPADAGNFSANVSATGAGINLAVKSKPVLIGAINIAGQLGEDGDGGVTLSSQAKIGAITVGSLKDVSINAADDITSLTSKGTAVDVRATSGQRMGAVSVINWLGGELTAQQFGTVTVKGQKGSAGKAEIAGDFTGKITAVGAPVGSLKAVDLGTVTVAGSFGLESGAQTLISVNGYMGELRAGAIHGAKVTIEGNWAGLTVKGAVDGLTAIAGVEGQDGAFTAGAVTGGVSVMTISNSTFHTGKMASFRVKGRKASAANGPAIAGDAMMVTLNIEDSAAKVGTVMLGTMTVEGTLDHSVVRVSDSVGMVSVGQIKHSDVFVGVVSTFEAGELPTSFLNFSRLQSKLTGFTVTGVGAAAGAATFVSSRVAAGQFLNVNLKLVAAPAEDETSGLAAGLKVFHYKRLVSAGSTQTVTVTNQLLPGTYDSPEGTSYVLRIVTRPPGMFM